MKSICVSPTKIVAIFKSIFLLPVKGYKYHEITGLMRPTGTAKSGVHFARKEAKI